MVTPILLLADDNEDFLHVRADSLEAAGFAVRRAAGIPAARAILDEDHIDLAILDYEFPGDITGLQLAQQAGQHIPKIILTAHYEAEIVSAALSADGQHNRGAVTCLDKQLELEPFLAAIETYLAEFRRAAERVTARNARALLVGVNSYKSVQPLSYCVADAKDISTVLDVSYTKHLVVPAKVGAPSPLRSDILTELRLFTKPQPDTDTLLFFFSGHGGVENNESYLLARDSRSDALEDTAVPVATVLEKMRNSRANAKVLLLDACNSGVDGDKGEQEFLTHIKEQARGVAILAACSRRQKTQESRRLKHGVFSYYLIQGLRGAADNEGRAEITVSGLHRYVVRQIEAYVRANPGSSAMTPTLYANMEGDIVLNYHRFRSGRPL